MCLRFYFNKSVIFLVGILLCQFTSFAWQLSGTIKSEDGMAVPYVSIYVQNTTYGVASNLKGQYIMELDNGTYQIVFQALGYKKKIITVNVEGSHKTVDVAISAKTELLSEINIEAEAKDPAYEIMKKAVENRKKYKHKNSAFSCNVYIKGNLQYEYFTHDTMNRKARDTIVNEWVTEKMNFMETWGNYHFRAPGDYKEEKLAVRDYIEKYKSSVTFSVTGPENESYESDFVNRQLFKSDLNEAEFNFYKSPMDLAALGPVPFISPLSPLGLLSYKFRLEENFKEGEFWINKIEVIPRRKNAALFKGYIFITDDWWNIKALELHPDKSELYFFDDFKIIHEYNLVNDSSWMLSREEYFYNSKEGKKHVLGNTVIRYSNYELDKIFPDKFFGRELRSTRDDAFDKDSVFWNEIRPVTLKEDEQLYIMEQDSINTFHKSESYLREQDSIYNHHDVWDYLLNGFGWQNSFRKEEIFVKPLIAQMYIFGVGGYRHAPGGGYKKEYLNGHELSVIGELNYGFKNGDLKGSVNGSYKYLPKKFGSLHAEYRNTYELLNEYESLQAILARGNYVNDVFYSVGHEMEITNGLFADATLEYGQKKPITGIELESWSGELFGEFNQPQDFEAYNECIVDVSLKYTFRQEYYTEPHKKINLPAKWPEIGLKFRKGIPGIFNASISFDYLEFRFKDDITVGTIGESRIRGYAGAFFTSDDLRITDYKYFRRSDPYIFSNPLKSFQLLRPGKRAISTTNPFYQLNYLHNFKGTVFNKIPVIKKLGIQEVCGYGMLVIQNEGFSHAEIFGGLEFPFRIRKQLFKFGTYYAVGYGNQSNLSGEFKFGIDFFNSWTNSWSY